MPDRAVVSGIIFVLKSGIPWELLPQELGCGSGMTCWRRLSDWQRAGVWERLHQALLRRLQEADKLDWPRASLDSASVAAKGRASRPGRIPTDRGKLGSKRHVVVDRARNPLAGTLSALNVHDVQMLAATLDATAPERGKRGRPRRRPLKLHADKSYHFAFCRVASRQRGITPRIARKCIESRERCDGIAVWWSAPWCCSIAIAA